MKRIENIKIKKHDRRKLKLASGIVLLCIVAGYVYFIFAWKSQLHKSSEDIIRQAVAKQLNKNLNQVKNKDFAAIAKLDLSGKEVYDIGLLSKFTNLEELNLDYIPLPEPDVPFQVVRDVIQSWAIALQ